MSCDTMGSNSEEQWYMKPFSKRSTGTSKVLTIPLTEFWGILGPVNKISFCSKFMTTSKLVSTVQVMMRLDPYKPSHITDHKQNFIVRLVNNNNKAAKLSWSAFWCSCTKATVVMVLCESSMLHISVTSVPNPLSHHFHILCTFFLLWPLPPSSHLNLECSRTTSQLYHHLSVCPLSEPCTVWPFIQISDFL